MGTPILESRQAKMALFNRPVAWIVIFGFLVPFVWEALQMPFYDMDHLSHWQMTSNCAFASIADAVLMAMAYLAARRFGTSRLSSPQPLFIYLGTGLVVTAIVEQLVVSAPWGWQYSAAMPVITGTHIGLVPIAMWVFIPLTTLWLAVRMTRGMP